MRKKKSITVGIVAYNEEENIEAMLKSVLAQKQQGYVIEKIIVISDGSTDDTAQIISGLRSKQITLYARAKRIGESAHLNTIFQKASSDIVVLFDADVVLSSPDTISCLIVGFERGDNIMYLGGNPQPTKGKTFIEKAVNISFEPYTQIRNQLHGADNPYGCDGRILALSREFYKRVKVPHDTIANDNYMYFACHKLGYDFLYIPEAVVYFRSPTTLADQLRQNKRFIAAHIRMERLFDPQAVRGAYHIPLRAKWPIVATLLKHPILSLSIYAINTYCAIRARIEERRMNALWAIAKTTKKEINR